MPPAWNRARARLSRLINFLIKRFQVASENVPRRLMWSQGPARKYLFLNLSAVEKGYRLIRQARNRIRVS